LKNELKTFCRDINFDSLSNIKANYLTK